MEIRNTDYNFIRNRMKRLEDTYKQSCDDNVRNIVKEKTFYEIASRIDGFYEMFAEAFGNCQMSSLMEIVKLSESVMGEYIASTLPTLAESEAKKMLKLKERDLDKFLREYNKAVQSGHLTYYSQIIDQKIVFIVESEGELIGTVGQVSRDKRVKESLCPFCRTFRRGDEIIFVTNKRSGRDGEYSTVGQYCCTDYVKCNLAIEDSSAMETFASYNQQKRKVNK